MSARSLVVYWFFQWQRLQILRLVSWIFYLYGKINIAFLAFVFYIFFCDRPRLRRSRRLFLLRKRRKRKVIMSLNAKDINERMDFNKYPFSFVSAD